MEYTVGSLAGLISGKSPDKKQKVVTKAFQTPSVQPETNLPSEKGPQKTDKSGKSQINTANSLTPVPKTETPKKLGKKKKSLTQQSFTGSETKAEKSPKKRKSQVSQPDLLDSDAEEQASPKKPKLTQNDENAIKRVKKKKRQEKQESPQYNDRTIFVGNVPIHTEKIKLKKHFKKYGLIESIRIRGIPVKDPKTPKKVAAIKKEFHPDRNTVFAYIRFADPECAKKAEAENGALFLEHHLRVQSCEDRNKHDESKAIFIGNLAFGAEEEDVRKIFQDCGEISHIRIVRDGRTGIGKGFGYVNFKESDSVQLALELENVKLKDRELRIAPCDIKRAKKKSGTKKPRYRRNKKSEQKGDTGSFEAGDKKESKRFTFKKGAKGKPNNQMIAPKKDYEGAKFDDKKKKPKFSKDSAQKKKLAKKLAPKIAA